MVTPCKQICKLDDADICVGCKRTIDEIVRWLSMTPAEREAVMRQLEDR